MFISLISVFRANHLLMFPSILFYEKSTLMLNCWLHMDASLWRPTQLHICIYQQKFCNLNILLFCLSLIIYFFFLAVNLSILLNFQGDWILSGGKSSSWSKLLHLHMYAVKCVNVGSTKDQFLMQVSDFAVLFGNELDAEVL